MENLTKKTQEVNMNSVAEEAFDKPVYIPETDIYEDSDNIFVISNIPGVSQKDIDVSLENKVLSFCGTQQERLKEGYEQVGASESAGVFKRSFKIETDIDQGKISALVKNGVLQITLPKAEALKPRQIIVKAG